MKQICELNDMIILGLHGRSSKAPRLTARAIVTKQSCIWDQQNVSLIPSCQRQDKHIGTKIK